MGLFSSIISDAKRSCKSDFTSTIDNVSNVSDVFGTKKVTTQPAKTHVEHTASNQYDLKVKNRNPILKNVENSGLRENSVKSADNRILNDNKINNIQGTLDKYDLLDVNIKVGQNNSIDEKKVNMVGMDGTLKRDTANELKSSERSPLAKTNRLEGKKNRIDANSLYLDHQHGKNEITESDSKYFSKNNEHSSGNKPNYILKESKGNNKKYKQIDGQSEKKSTDNHIQNNIEVKRNAKLDIFSISDKTDQTEAKELFMVDATSSTEKQNRDVSHYNISDGMQKKPKERKPKERKPSEHDIKIPQVIIDQIDVYVTAPEKTTATQSRQDNSSSFLSRYYIKG